jgi:hypothetical protein
MMGTQREPRPRGCWRCSRIALARSRQTLASSARAAPQEELAMDKLVAEAVLEFGDDLRHMRRELRMGI